MFRRIALIAVSLLVGPGVLSASALAGHSKHSFQPGAPGVGDEAFFRLLRTWVREQAGGHVTIPEFIATAERVTRMQLDDLFETWLFTPSRPAVESAPTAAARALKGGGVLPPRFFPKR